MKYKYLILALVIAFLPCTANAQNKAYRDALVKVITSKTGGFVIQEEDKKGEYITQIALPKSFNHYTVTSTLSSTMIDLEQSYISLKPWKVLDNGILCNFNLAKDNSKDVLSLLYYPDNKVLVLHETKESDMVTNMRPKNAFENFRNFILWGAVIYSEGFIREETDDEMKYTVAIQMQEEQDVTKVIAKLKPLYDTLDTAYYLDQPWTLKDEVYECGFGCKIKDGSLVYAHFYYFPNSYVLLISLSK